MKYLEKIEIVVPFSGYLYVMELFSGQFSGIFVKKSFLHVECFIYFAVPPIQRFLSRLYKMYEICVSQ